MFYSIRSLERVPGQRYLYSATAFVHEVNPHSETNNMTERNLSGCCSIVNQISTLDLFRFWCPFHVDVMIPRLGEVFNHTISHNPGYEH